ncbi:MAG: hypothetical protein WA941_12130 [Nitrososphaeraceae archaeon]
MSYYHETTKDPTKKTIQRETVGVCIDLPSDLYTAIKTEAFYQSKSMVLLINEMLQYHFLENVEKPIKK